MAVVDWILQYRWIILFYVIIALIIYINRKKWQVENKFILLYRTNYGVNFINKFADKNKEFVKVVGYSAIGVGFIGMLAIIGFFVKGTYDLLFVPSAPPTMSLVIPGIQIPGSPIFVPFWFGIIALFVVVLFHEFGHGIVARAHGIPIKSTGIVFFGPLIGAFVEPDEKKITKSSSAIQTSMFASGPFFNVILCVFIFLILNLLLYPAMNSMTQPTGITFDKLVPGEAAEKYGLQAGQVYTKINDLEAKDSEQVSNLLSCMAPNQSLTFYGENSSVTVITGAHPDNPNKGYLGVKSVNIHQELKSESKFAKFLYSVLSLLGNPNNRAVSDYRLFEWIFMLSLGIGLANLLPMGPVDGGRMLHTALVDIKGKEKGVKLWARIGWITLFVLLILLLVPIIRSIIFKV